LGRNTIFDPNIRDNTQISSTKLVYEQPNDLEILIQQNRFWFALNLARKY
jgi:hypothetical protein